MSSRRWTSLNRLFASRSCRITAGVSPRGQSPSSTRHSARLGVKRNGSMEGTTQPPARSVVIGQRRSDLSACPLPSRSVASRYLGAAKRDVDDNARRPNVDRLTSSSCFINGSTYRRLRSAPIRGDTGEPPHAGVAPDRPLTDGGADRRLNEPPPPIGPLIPCINRPLYDAEDVR
jgi:hypothetical protein